MKKSPYTRLKKLRERQRLARDYFYRRIEAIKKQRNLRFDKMFELEKKLIEEIKQAELIDENSGLGLILNRIK